MSYTAGRGDGEVQKLMSDAAAVIGAGRPDDYLLRPVEHAEGLRAAPPSLPRC